MGKKGPDKVGSGITICSVLFVHPGQSVLPYKINDANIFLSIKQATGTRQLVTREQDIHKQIQINRE